MGQYKEQWILFLRRTLHQWHTGDTEEMKVAQRILIEMASVESAIGGGKKNGSK